jgi:hypothetical protein
MPLSTAESAQLTSVVDHSLRLTARLQGRPEERAVIDTLLDRLMDLRRIVGTVTPVPPAAARVGPPGLR